MPQNVVFTSKRSILNETLNAAPQLNKLMNELKKTGHLISNKESSEEQERYVTTYQQLYEKGYEHKKNQAKKILINLGFTEAQLDQPVTYLSSGWKMRLILAGILLQEANFYLFDEPTNHLDLPAKDWFVEFLHTSSCGFMLVSHDEYFLNTVCDYIYKISNGHLTGYRGNYQSYMYQKKHNENILKKNTQFNKKL
jgi:ATP-binding cassette subfamily F protein 3